MERGFALEDPDGTVTALPPLWSDPGVRMNEGGGDPDGSRVYYNDTATFAVSVFDYDPTIGLTDRRTFAELPDGGRPDGLTVDSEGGVWTAVSIRDFHGGVDAPEPPERAGPNSPEAADGSPAPAWMLLTVSTAVSVGDTSRATTICARTTIIGAPLSRDLTRIGRRWLGIATSERSPLP